MIVGALGVPFLELRWAPRSPLTGMWAGLSSGREAVKRGGAAKDGIVADFWELRF